MFNDVPQLSIFGAPERGFPPAVQRRRAKAGLTKGIWVRFIGGGRALARSAQIALPRAAGRATHK
jgi:hypothetical protein